MRGAGCSTCVWVGCWLARRGQQFVASYDESKVPHYAADPLVSQSGQPVRDADTGSSPPRDPELFLARCMAAAPSRSPSRPRWSVAAIRRWAVWRFVARSI